MSYSNSLLILFLLDLFDYFLFLFIILLMFPFSKIIDIVFLLNYSHCYLHRYNQFLLHYLHSFWPYSVYYSGALFSVSIFNFIASSVVEWLFFQFYLTQLYTTKTRRNFILSYKTRATPFK